MCPSATADLEQAAVSAEQAALCVSVMEADLEQAHGGGH